MRAALPTPDLVGSYRIHGLIADGGMGSVYRGAHLVLSRVAAIKVMHADMLEIHSAVERMYQEAQILAHIEDPTIVKVYDAGRLPDGRPWVAMELLDGMTLLDHMFVHERLPLVEVIRITVAVAKALMRAHSLGVIHRDVKPENIMLVGGPGGLGVKLIDWGIAHINNNTNLRLTQHDYSPGTPCYMAPEQLRGHAVDGRADTYALGVVIYQMLSGALPFDGEQPLEIALKTLHEVVPPFDRALQLPPQIDHIIRAMLAKNPAQRPPLDRVCAAFSGWAEECEEDYEEMSLEIEIDMNLETGYDYGCVSGEIIGAG